MNHPIIIIGAGLAGYQLAREFRKLDQTTPLTIVTADAGDFYSKPLLSTALTNKKTAKSLVMSDAQSMAGSLNAAILTQHQVSAIDVLQQEITIDGKKLSYSKLVLACGANNVKPNLMGDGNEDVLSINHLSHYEIFEKHLAAKSHVAILGAGLVGCEFANDLCNAGFKVEVIAPANTPLSLLVPEQVGTSLQNALAELGVQWHLNTLAESIQRCDSGYSLSLSNGKTLTVDLVIAAIGLLPRTDLAVNAGLAVNRGIKVNRFLETSAENVYALGDCAEVEGHLLPFIAPLLQCTRALAKTLNGEKTAVDYPAMPVTVKTPGHPITICPPPKNCEGEWRFEHLSAGIRALFYDLENTLCGFALTGEGLKDKMALTKQLPALIS